MRGRSESPGQGSRRVGVIGGLGLKPIIPLSLAGRRLIAYLAVKKHPVSRSVAFAELWPDVPEDCGRANLRRALWHVPRGWITALGEDLILEASTDLADAEAVIMRALAGENLALHEIRALCEDLLPGWHDEWVVRAQEEFRLLRVQALEAACRNMAEAGAHALATQAGAAALAAEPLRESAADALIEAHLAQGNRFEALQCFKSLASRLRTELGVSPNPVISERVACLDRARARHVDESRTPERRRLAESATH